MHLITAMLKEYNFVVNERNREMMGDEKLDDGEEWIWITDFETGEKKKVKQVKTV